MAPLINVIDDWIAGHQVMMLVVLSGVHGKSESDIFRKIN